MARDGNGVDARRDEEWTTRGERNGTNCLSSFRAMGSSVLDVDGVADKESIGTVDSSRFEGNESEEEGQNDERRRSETTRRERDSRVDQPIHREPNREPNRPTAEETG